MYARYPLGLLLLAAIAKKEIRRSPLAKALGYANINRGLRRLDQCIAGEGVCNQDFLNNVAQVLEIADEDLDNAIDLSNRQLETEEKERDRRIEEYGRRTFKPYLYFLTERSRPSSITTVGFIGAQTFLCLGLPEGINRLPGEKEIQTVSEIIKKHHPGEPHTHAMFGNITGYIYRYSYDESMKFSTKGELLQKGLGRIPEGKSTLQIGNKSVEGGILDKWGKPVKFQA